MIAIGTGLKTEFLGTVKISYGCILCIVAFSLAAVLCPVYLTDARNTAKQFKKVDNINNDKSISLANLT
jgi:uncharacterized membrane protein (DUF485 family)